MGYREERAGISHQSFFHRFSGGNVQMVGRFVQNQEVGACKHQLQKGHTRLLTAGEVANLAQNLITMEQESAQITAGLLLVHTIGVDDFIKHRHIHMQGFMLLRKITDFHPAANFYPAFGGFQLTHEDFEQGGLARTIRANERHAVPIANQEGQVLKYRLTAIAKGDFFQFCHPLCTFRRLMEGKVIKGRGFRRQHNALQAVELALPSSRLLGFDACLILADIFLRFFDMLLLFFVSGFERLPPGRLDPHKVGVVALIAGDGMIFQFHHAGGHLVKKITVMGDNQHTAAIGAQKAFKPFNHPDVEMVGRLVQKEEIRLPQ